MMLSVGLGERRPARQRPGPARCWCRAGHSAWSPDPEAAEPLIRSQIGTIERVLARSGVWTKLESGTSMPLSFGSSLQHDDGRRLEEVVPDDVARDETLGLRGEQRTRSGGVLRALRALERLREPGQARGPGTRATRSTPGGPSRSGPGGSSSSALVTPSSCWRTRLVSCVCSSAGLMPWRRQRIAQLAADALGLTRDRSTCPPCSRRTRRASCSPGSSAPTAAAGRRSGSRRRSGRAGAAAA